SKRAAWASPRWDHENRWPAEPQCPQWPRHGSAGLLHEIRRSTENRDLILRTDFFCGPLRTLPAPNGPPERPLQPAFRQTRAFRLRWQLSNAWDENAGAPRAEPRPRCLSR